MKLGLFVLFASLSFSSFQAHAHDEARVSIEMETKAPAQAGSVSLRFELVDLKDKVVLSDQELSILHEKKLHLFIFDPALKEFHHEHPVFENGKWAVSTTVPVNGNYWVWAQGEIAKDSEEFFAGVQFEVTGGLPANVTPPVLKDLRSGTDTSSKVTLSNTKIQVKKMTMLMLDLSRTDGKKPVITPYLGAAAHVVGVTSDGDSLIHVHPMATSKPTQLMLHATFLDAGFYRLWVQFIDNGTLKTVPLSVEVFP